MKKLIYAIIILLVCFNMNLIAGVPSFTINGMYTFSNTSLIDGTVYKTDSIVLKIKTASETECFYGTSTYPYTPFEGEYGLTHEAYLKNLEEGFHKYYVRCGDTSNPVMEVGFATSIPIYATIKISEEPPIKEGKYKISLITSKTSQGTPTLEYSLDEVVYRPITLKGAGENWEGNLIIPGNVGETVCSLRFKARDLSGEEGNKIVGENLFIVDTVKPETIGVINAVGYQGQIKLNWFIDEKVSEFNIYKSENPQIDYTQFYKSSTKNTFYDNDVEKGKTYYYRVAAVDEAGNIGDLSREVYATALLTNYTKETGLNPRLVGKVDSSISEINSIVKNIEDITSLIELKDEKEKSIIKEIKLNQELTNALSELNSLKRDVENYKLQDLSEEELNKKISSVNLRLNIIKKKIPEDITILEEKNINRELSEENVQKALFEYSGEGDTDNRKEITETLKNIEENNIKIISTIYSLEILYLDGTKKRITLIEENIESKIESLENFYYIISVPKEIAETSSELKVINLEYEVIKDDPVLSFKSDTKKIVYYLNKELSVESIEDILIAPISIIDEDIKESKITGNSILNYSGKGSLGIIILVAFALILAVYFLKIKNESSIKPVLKLVEDIKKSKELVREGKEKEANEIYDKVKEEYKNLSEKEKKIVMDSIKSIGEDIQK